MCMYACDFRLQNNKLSEAFVSFVLTSCCTDRFKHKKGETVLSIEVVQCGFFLPLTQLDEYKPLDWITNQLLTSLIFCLLIQVLSTSSWTCSLQSTLYDRAWKKIFDSNFILFTLRVFVRRFTEKIFLTNGLASNKPTPCLLVLG